jgi:hypothetical protein
MSDAETPAPLEYETPRPDDRGYRQVLSIIRRARVVTVPLLAAGLWYVSLHFRTYGEGGPWPQRLFACVVFSLIFGVVPAALVWLGLPLRRYVLAVLLTAFIPEVLSEGYATLEEHLFVARCRTLSPTTPTVFKDRWWPNEAHYLYYDPATGELGGGD